MNSWYNIEGKTETIWTEFYVPYVCRLAIYWELIKSFEKKFYAFDLLFFETLHFFYDHYKNVSQNVRMFQFRFHSFNYDFRMSWYEWLNICSIQIQRVRNFSAHLSSLVIRAAVPELLRSHGLLSAQHSHGLFRLHHHSEFLCPKAEEYCQKLRIFI